MLIESNRVEFKEKLTDSLEKEVVAFLNYLGGGIIYLGVNKKGVVKGVENADSLQLTIKDRLRNNIVPSCLGLFDIVLEEEKGLSFIKIIVASGQERLYYIKKYGMSERGAFIRKGSASEPMSPTMIEKLFAKRIRNSVSKIKSPRQDLSFEQLKIYYDSVGKTLNNQFSKNLELLNEDGDYNYVAYLMADNNSVSVKVAKYSGVDRVDLIENEEYGFCSIIKATKQVLDRIEVENKTHTKITSRERLEKRMWNAVAIREAVINVMVHNDYTYELAPKFEFFSNRFEITSYGGLPDGLSKEEFFEGVSIPRNKEIMRIYRDIDLVEQLGSGIPRILQFYSKNSFKFSENFTRMSFLIEHEIIDEKVINVVNEQVTEQVTEQVKSLIKILKGEMDRREIQEKLGLVHRENFRSKYLKPALDDGLVTMTIPNKPNSRNQKYTLSERGEILKYKLDSIEQ